MDNLNREIEFSDNLSNINATIIGITVNKKQFINKVKQKEYYCLSFSNLLELAFDKDKILETLNLNKFNENNTTQKEIVTNIIDLVNKGNKKLVIDELFIFLEHDVKAAIIKYLNVNKVNYINITSEMEETLYADYLIVYYNEKIAIEGSTLEVLKEEKILKRLGYNLPFMVDLSIQLKYYGLIDKIYLNQEELVKVLWS